MLYNESNKHKESRVFLWPIIRNTAAASCASAGAGILPVAGLLVLLILLSAVGLLWKRLHREQSPAAVQGPTIFQQELQSSEWNTISYTPARRLTVQTTSAGSTAMDFRLAALDRTTAVDRSYFANVCFLGDSLTQGMQIYSSGLPEASFCAYRGANPSVVVNGTTCKRSDGGTEVPMEVLTAQQPRCCISCWAPTRSTGTGIIPAFSPTTGSCWI